MTTVLIATRNLHKVEEIRSLLPGDLGLLTLRDFSGAPCVIEDANTFAGNAAKKAVELARWLSASGSQVTLRRRGGRLFVLADDSGLEVDALHGAPGVHSARFAAAESAGSENAPDAANNSKLLNLLKEVPANERTARFRCVIALTPVLETVSENRTSVCYADEAEWQTELFDGVCEGQIGFAPRGEKGFGYDPLFLPAGFDQTFAELGEQVKNQISHRAQALAKLAARLRAAGELRTKTGPEATSLPSD